MSNNELAGYVMEELHRDPKVDDSTIAVTSDDGGIVTLRGTVGSCREKRDAQHDAEQIYGVVQVRATSTSASSPSTGATTPSSAVTCCRR
jgi:osmotically-inducible protein OsmY